MNEERAERFLKLSIRIEKGFEWYAKASKEDRDKYIEELDKLNKEYEEELNKLPSGVERNLYVRLYMLSVKG